MSRRKDAAPAKPPEVPKRVLVEWPGGPYDFEVECQPGTVWLQPAVEPGWFWVTGWVVKPEGVQHRRMGTFYAEQVGPETFRMIRMIPKRP